ncbi:hydantoinase B/oxoprolinase family protein [Hydrogenophaga sp.]|uniref:hydantoinase B/oxoprolinase family protein n=1 Tax=Hydrogenophaga sp. TaxID=1904254 RepID=UPI002720680B|nr:hydantoinase B/oxoprolinase family protein [Hydrogenophaga sp.]MDO9433828.1 hydantoinase B/oxoprolinase family protein [Hydrogenophaga sp.]
MTATAFLSIDQQVMWDRLIALTEEQAQVLLRTAFSTIVRESGDLAVGVFDAHARMLAQAVTGTPGHVNSMARTVGHVLAKYPADTMRPGDVFLTNDPWLGTGHTNDFTAVTPCFLQDALVGFVACNSHLMDVGGMPGSHGSTDVFMEGLYIPILKIVDAGVVNDTLMTMIRANSRLPEESEGDTYALIACNAVGSQRLLDMMREFALTDLQALADHIINTSRDALRAAIGELPQGTWHNTLTLDGIDEPIVLKAALTIHAGAIAVDYTGTSGMVKHNINVPLCYTLAYTTFGIRCIVGKDIPNNAGSLEPITVTAPPGSIVNAAWPAAVVSRHLIGLMLPDLVFGCLREAASERVPAEGASSLWVLSTTGKREGEGPLDRGFRASVVNTGGMGALPHRDGLSATGYPSGIMGGSIEMFETACPLIVWRKELRMDSAGAGRSRGGLGLLIEVQNSIDEPFLLRTVFDRMAHPARGVDGGCAGAPGQALLDNLRPLAGKGLHEIAPGQRVTLKTPGGAGMGAPCERPRDAVVRDLAFGYISGEAARTLYQFEPPVASEKPRP